MRDDRNYYELTRGPVDGPAPGDVRYLTVPNRLVRALSATVLSGLGCERLHRAPSANLPTAPTRLTNRSMNDIGSRWWPTTRSLRTAPPPRRPAARHQPECQRSAVDAIGGALPCPGRCSPRRTRSTRKHSALVVERPGCDVIGGRPPSAPAGVRWLVRSRAASPRSSTRGSWSAKGCPLRSSWKSVVILTVLLSTVLHGVTAYPAAG